MRAERVQQPHPLVDRKSGKRHPAVCPARHCIWTEPRAWLKERGIQVKSVRAESGIDLAADRLAIFLGERLETLAGFYECIKRRVSGGPGKWYSAKDMPGVAITDICQFGTMLHSSGFLSEFRYIKRDRNVLCVPVEDGRVTNFFTGGWLERYALHLVKRAVTSNAGAWNDAQALLGAAVTLPDDADSEFDILVGLPASGVLWLECKTSDWQTHVTRFQAINKRHMQLPRDQAALVLLDRLADDEKDSASALTGMTVLHLSELSDWLTATVSGA